MVTRRRKCRFCAFPLNRGKAVMRHYASSSEKSPVFAPVKITIACARLFLLRSTTNFFRQCVPPVGRNANARSFCLRGMGGFGLLFFGVNAVLTLSSLQRKSFYAALRLLFRKKARQRSHVKNYRSARFFTAHLTTAFFRQSVPLFVRNALARSFCL